jgi:hypothetical protein
MGRVQTIAIYILILALPFNGIRPILDIGELSSEGFFYGSLIYLALVLPVLVIRGRSPLSAVMALTRLQWVYIAAILAFSLLNLGTIVANEYGTRTGVERFAVSLLTYFYYLALSAVIVTHALDAGIERFLGVVSRAFVALGSGLALYCSLELASWFLEPLRPVLTGFRALFAINAERTPWRLSGVSLEPSFNAFALLATAPWALLRAGWTGKRRYGFLAAMLVVLSLVSGARTAYAGLAAMAIALALHRGVLRRVLPGGLDGALFVAAMFVIGLVLPLIGFSMIEAGSPASNVTRAYLSTAAISAGLDSFWGQGFGQVTFHVVRQASSLIGYSWELTDFYYGTRHGVLPPLYSWYARSFGEFGITGYVLVGLGFSLVARRLFAIGHRTEGATARALLFLGAMFLFQFLAMALSIESLRVPQFWFAWIFIALLFFHLKPSGRTNG